MHFSCFSVSLCMVMMSWTIWVCSSYPDGRSFFNVGATLMGRAQCRVRSKGIGFRFGCQFSQASVFPHKPRPFLIDTPVVNGLRIVPVHEPDIAVDDLKTLSVLDCHVLIRSRMAQKARLIFQPDFKSGSYLCVRNGISCFLYCS